jgi:hypothetical protein
LKGQDIRLVDSHKILGLILDKRLDTKRNASAS